MRKCGKYIFKISSNMVVLGTKNGFYYFYYKTYVDIILLIITYDITLHTTKLNFN